MVLAAQVDAPGVVAVGAYGDGGAVVVGVGVDDEPPVADVVVDLLSLVRGIPGLCVDAPGHRIRALGLLLVDRGAQPGGDLGGEALFGQSQCGLLGPVRLLMVDAGHDQSVVVDSLEAAGAQQSASLLLGGAADRGDHGAVRGVAVEADVRLGEGGDHEGVLVSAGG
ncbi:hypothetical protein ACWC24_14010 [Streptomyces sp. NPDC001443]